MNWLWVVSLFLLFSFQGSVFFCLPLFSAVSDILSYHFLAVKYFISYFVVIFQTISTAFDILQYLNLLVKHFISYFICSFDILWQRMIYYHITICLSRTFLFSFWKLFLLFILFCRLFQRRGLYYHNQNPLSTIFLHFFIYFFILCNLIDCITIYLFLSHIKHNI